MATARKAKTGATASRNTAAASKFAEVTAEGREQQQAHGAQPQRDAAELLKADHREVEQLFERFEKADDEQQKADIVRQLCTDLVVHSELEEEIFYPACRQKLDEKDPLDEAQVEHDGAKVLIADLMSQRPGSPFFDAKVKVLKEYIRHHVAEEDKPGEGILAKAASSGVDMQALGQQVEARKKELMAQASESNLSLPQPRSFDIRRQGGRNFRQENQDMERRFDRDRDERGRFTSDEDDDRRFGSTSGRGRGGGGRYAKQDDDREEGRGWRGDPQGHSEASRRGWEERGGSRSRGRDDDDDSRRSSSRGGDEGRGWYGDPQGHSEASRRGWDEREGSRARGRDDDDDDRRGGGSDRDHGGWFGDSRGHAEAARRGWRNRG